MGNLNSRLQINIVENEVIRSVLIFVLTKIFRYRHFLDSSGNALTIIACFTDIPERGGGTALCEDGIASKSSLIAT